MSLDAQNGPQGVDTLKQEAMIIDLEHRLTMIPPDQRPQEIAHLIQDARLNDNALEFLELLEYKDELAIGLSLTEEEVRQLGKMHIKLVEAQRILTDFEDKVTALPLDEREGMREKISASRERLEQGCRFAMMLFEELLQTQAGEKERKAFIMGLKDQIGVQLCHIVLGTGEAPARRSIKAARNATGKWHRRKVVGFDPQAKIEVEGVKEQVGDLFDALEAGEEEETTTGSAYAYLSAAAEWLRFHPAQATAALVFLSIGIGITLKISEPSGLRTLQTPPNAQAEREPAESGQSSASGGEYGGSSVRNEVPSDPVMVIVPPLQQIVVARAEVLLQRVVRGTTAEERQNAIQAAQAAAAANNDPEGYLKQWQELDRNGAIFASVLGQISQQGSTLAPQEIERALAGVTSGGYTLAQIQSAIQECEGSEHPDAQAYVGGWQVHEQRILNWRKEVFEIAAMAR